MEGQSLWIQSCSSQDEDEDAEPGQPLPWVSCRAQGAGPRHGPAGHSLQLKGLVVGAGGMSCSGPSVFSLQARESRSGAPWGTRTPPPRAPARARPLTHKELSKDWVPESGTALQSSVAVCRAPFPKHREISCSSQGGQAARWLPGRVHRPEPSEMVFEKVLCRSGRGSGDETSWKGLCRRQPVAE